MSRTSSIPPFKVLVVEDNFCQLQLLIEVLTKAGIRTNGCLTESQALEALQADDTYRLLVIDLKLSGQLNGFELGQLARRKLQDITVLFITGYSKDIAYRLKCADRNAELLLKPFSLSKFVDKVATLLAQ